MIGAIDRKTEMSLADAGVNCFSMYDADEAVELPEGNAAVIYFAICHIMASWPCAATRGHAAIHAAADWQSALCLSAVGLLWCFGSTLVFEQRF